MSKIYNFQVSVNSWLNYHRTISLELRFSMKKVEIIDHQFRKVSNSPAQGETQRKSDNKTNFRHGLHKVNASVGVGPVPHDIAKADIAVDPPG